VRRGKDIQFGFDRVFDQYATQYEVFQHTTQVLVNEVLNGYNCACFAYGATGAGKTFTMVGTESAPGVMVLTLQELFSAMKATQDDKKYSVKISYLEVYNENIHDLLVPQSKPLALLESGDNMTVLGLTQHEPNSADEILQLLQEGNTRRAQNFTHANAESSRSHAVLQVIVEQRDRTANVTTGVRTAKFSLIDLAGSERASRTKNRGKQLVEGANINRSLLALGNCINALGSGYTEGKYVPYRDSKLTRLLKDSLGGNCKTIMISNVSPSTLSYEDTFNTLQYANRAKNIKTKVRHNEINLVVHVSQYKDIIADLRKEVEEWKHKCSSYEQQLEEEGRARQAAIDMEFDEQVSSSSLSSRMRETSSISSQSTSSQTNLNVSRPNMTSSSSKPIPSASLPLLSRTVSMGLATPRNSKIEKRLINLSSQVDDVISDRRNVQKHLEEILSSIIELAANRTLLIGKIRDSEEVLLKMQANKTPLASPRVYIGSKHMGESSEMQESPMKLLDEAVDEIPIATPAKRTARLHRTSPPRDMDLRKELELLDRKLEEQNTLRSTLLQRLGRNAETTKRLQNELSQFTPHAEDVSLHRQLKLELVINALELSNFNRSMHETQLTSSLAATNERFAKALDLVDILRAALGEHIEEEPSEFVVKYEQVMQTPVEEPESATLLQLPSPYAAGGRSPFMTFTGGRSPFTSFASAAAGLDAAGPATPSRFHSGAQDSIAASSSSSLTASSIDSPSIKSGRIPFSISGGAAPRGQDSSSSTGASRSTQNVIRPNVGASRNAIASTTTSSRPNPLIRSGKKSGSGVSVTGSSGSRVGSISSSSSRPTNSSASAAPQSSTKTATSRIPGPGIAKSHVRIPSTGASSSSASTSATPATSSTTTSAVTSAATAKRSTMGLPQRVGAKPISTATSSSANGSAKTTVASQVDTKMVTPTKLPHRFRNDPQVAKALATFKPTFEPTEKSTPTSSSVTASNGSIASSSSTSSASRSSVAVTKTSSPSSSTASTSTTAASTPNALGTAFTSNSASKMNLAKSSSSPTANAISNLANIQAGLSSSASTTSVSASSGSTPTSSATSYKYEPNALAALLAGSNPSFSALSLDSVSPAFSRPPTAGTVYSPSSPSSGISSSPLVVASRTSVVTGSPVSPMSKPMRV
jgi:hypothetical protein